jgi:hypothetical protein
LIRGHLLANEPEEAGSISHFPLLARKSSRTPGVRMGNARLLSMRV